MTTKLTLLIMYIVIQYMVPYIYIYGNLWKEKKKSQLNLENFHK